MEEVFFYHIKGWGKYLNRNNSFCLNYRIHSQSTPTFPLKSKHIGTTNQIPHKWLPFSRYFRCSTNCIFGSNRTKQGQFIYQSCHPNTVFKSQFCDAIEDDFFPRRCNKQSLRIFDSFKRFYSKLGIQYNATSSPRFQKFSATSIIHSFYEINSFNPKFFGESILQLS